MIQHLINHIGLVVDRSGSMRGQPVVKVFALIGCVAAQSLKSFTTFLKTAGGAVRKSSVNLGTNVMAVSPC